MADPDPTPSESVNPKWDALVAEFRSWFAKLREFTDNRYGEH